MSDTAESRSGCDKKLMIKLRKRVNTIKLWRRSKLEASFFVTMEDNEKESSGFVPDLSDLKICRLLWFSEIQRLCHEDSPASA
jgi:hypothetical protein